MAVSLLSIVNSVEMVGATPKGRSRCKVYAWMTEMTPLFGHICRKLRVSGT